MKRGFGSDNHSGVHPALFQAIEKANIMHAPSYGTDDWSHLALSKFKEHFGPQSEAFFVFNGTAANVTALKAMIQSYQSVLCADVSHLNVDECGAPEFFTGAKLIPIPSKDGKIIASELERLYIRRGDQHHSQVHAISITQPTELGTVYTVAELQEIILWAKSKKLLIHIDGARLANAAHSLQLSLKEFTTDLGVDVVSMGGTKNGFMMGEAVVFLNAELAQNFKFIRKQATQLPSKTRFIAAQFAAYLDNNLYSDIAKHSCQMALHLYEELKKYSQIEIRCKPQSNAVFAKIPKSWIKALRNECFFYVWDETTFECRLMTSWDTQTEDISRFINKVKELSQL